MPETKTDLLNYADYLRLDLLLEAQQPLSDHADELHFIVIHQVHELWFKLALNFMERAREATRRGEAVEAARLLGQISLIFENAVTTAEHLHTLPPMAFHRFRFLLAPGSGLQSYQFREIEFLAGYRDPRHLEWVKRMLAKDEQWEGVQRRLAEDSLLDVFMALLAERGVKEIADLYAAPQDHPELYLLADALSILDQRVVKWRHTHIQLVERTIGTGVIGTGGTTHDYLQATLRIRLFPDLWEARNALTHRVNEGLPPPGG
jgi:tryptophan 2,3-dioxygenase